MSMENNQSQEQGCKADSESMNRDLLFLVIQFLRQEGLLDSAHSLERDSGVYFDLCYFEERIQAGAWEEVEWYIKGYFRNVQQNSHGSKLLFEIYKWKYIDALLRRETSEAVKILQNEIRPLVPPDDKAYEELVLLLPQDHEARLRNLQNVRSLMCVEIRRLVLQCPDLQNKLSFPSIPPSRLTILSMQSLNWQHHLCLRKQPVPAMTTLLQDHNCPLYGPAQNIQASPAGPSSRPEVGLTGGSSDKAALR